MARKGVCIVSRRNFEFVAVLEVHPTPGVGFERTWPGAAPFSAVIPRRPRVISLILVGATPIAFANAAGRQGERLHEVVLQHFAGMDRIKSGHGGFLEST